MPSVSRSEKNKNHVMALSRTLFDICGPSGWWPLTETPGKPPVYRPGEEGKAVSDTGAFEVITGAILTQNTSWKNVEKALVNLTGAGMLDIGIISGCGEILEEMIRPSGYYNQKAGRLRHISRRILECGGVRALCGCPTEELRARLLSWKGIGPETADSILCYGFARPVFPVDRYTARLFERLGLPSGFYDEIQELVHEAIPPSAAVYGDFHAHIVQVSATGAVEALLDRLGPG